MKNIYIILLSVVLLFSCNEEEESILVDSLADHRLEPTVPGLIYPTNNLVCTNFNLEFDWNISKSIYRKPLRYVVDIATDREFTNVLFTSTTSETESIFTLEKGTSYFWRVKAQDDKGNESLYSTIQTFFTEPNASINTIPAVSSIVNPASGSTVTGSTVTLDWNATDRDEDALLFDVYFGESNPPQLIAENLDTSTFDVAVSANTEYYWRIVAKDSKQGAAISQVWSFRTQ